MKYIIRPGAGRRAPASVRGPERGPGAPVPPDHRDGGLHHASRAGAGARPRRGLPRGPPRGVHPGPRHEPARDEERRGEQGDRQERRSHPQPRGPRQQGAVLAPRYNEVEIFNPPSSVNSKCAHKYIKPDTTKPGISNFSTGANRDGCQVQVFI